MNLKKIISEEFNYYINSLIQESEDDKESNEISKKRAYAKRRDGKNVSVGDEAQIRHDVDNADLINVAALAREVYPDHTPEGAQSQLRKKLKGLKNDNGSEYHIKQREAAVIRKALNDI